VIPLPEPEVLARLLSQVTSTMAGISFSPTEAVLPSMDAQWLTAVLPIAGARPLTIGLASDLVSCQALTAALFSCLPSEVDTAMSSDSLRELANMTAGLIKSSLKLDQALGLPVVRPGAITLFLPPNGQSVMLRADQLGLLLWVTEGLPST